MSTKVLLHKVEGAWMWAFGYGFFVHSKLLTTFDPFVFKTAFFGALRTLKGFVILQAIFRLEEYVINWKRYYEDKPAMAATNLALIMAHTVAFGYCFYHFPQGVTSFLLYSAFRDLFHYPFIENV
eukprot:Platyproteum_vivax@DN6429_c0_g1_i3.p2